MESLFANNNLSRIPNKLQFVFVLIISALVFEKCNKTPEARVITEQKVQIPESFDRNYEGNIGPQYSLIMKLTKNKNIVDGYYSISIDGKKLKLSGSIEDSGQIIILGFSNEGKLLDQFKGKFLSSTELEGV